MRGAKDLTNRLDLFSEWLLVSARGRSFPLLRDEIDVEIAPEGSFFSVIDDSGCRRWRLVDLAADGDEIDLTVAGAFGKEKESLRLVPRTPASVLAAEIEIARQKAADEIARLAVEVFPASRVDRIGFNERGGRLAEIILTTGDKNSVAIIADVTASVAHTSLMAATIAWSEKLAKRKKPIYEILIVAEKPQARRLRKLHALLNKHWQGRISIARVDRRMETPVLQPVSQASLSELWRDKQGRFKMPAAQVAGRIAKAVTALAPDKIDVLRSKSGETLRFFGLPFVRVRKMLGREQAWFGIGKTQQQLNDTSWDEIETLVGELNRLRSADPPSKRHELYKASAEAWLESSLRRDITQLDANLFLSPIYDQFRSPSEKIDLLALRSDGRLIVIEIKVQPDRQVIFQSAEYWRKIELQRRRGDLERANLFGDKKIADRPAIIYLAAPAWSIHRDIDLFARALSPEIELWRFDLHEDWRREIKVVARTSYSEDRLSR